jgi:hypothetical protein
MNIHKIASFIVYKISERNLKFNIYYFQNAILIDIWYNNYLYVIQIDKTSIGFSKVDDENNSFDSIPDEIFYNLEDFMIKLINEIPVISNPTYS